MKTFATFYEAFDYVVELELSGYEASVTPQEGGYVVTWR